jgi:SAM-dependent methyltransferase
VQSLAEVRERIREQSPFPDERTQEIVRVRFARVPHRVAFALRRWPLETHRVLDVGSAYGACLVHFGPGSVGVDNSPEAVEFTRALGLDARLLDVDDESLDVIPDDAFDYIWVSDVLEHLEAPRLLLRNLRTKLKPTGRLLLHTSVLPRSRLVRFGLRRGGRAPFDAWAHYHQFTAEGLRHLLARAGYRTAATVVPVPTRYAWLCRLVPAGVAPRLIFEAKRDAGLEQIADTSEQKKKHLS